MRPMYRAACKVEFQPFKRLYSQLTFFNFYKKQYVDRLHNGDCHASASTFSTH